MKKIYTTAQGKQVDIDSLRIANEQTIAVGNMKVNARGDELGPGGSVATTRNQAMDTYYKLNANVPSDAVVPDVAQRQRSAGATAGKITTPSEAQTEDTEVFEPNITPEAPAVPATTTRGSLAGSVAKQTTVTQELLKPLNKRNGITRI